MASRKIEDHELQLDLQAYYDAGGNKSEAARKRGLPRKTYHHHLRLAEKTLGVNLGRVADGRVSAVEAKKLGLPRKGKVKYYLLTSVQNNTFIHPAWETLLDVRDYYDGLENSDGCQLLVGTYSYNKNAYGHDSVKRNKKRSKTESAEWYAKEAEPFISDELMQLAPGLMWNGNWNSLPTAADPLMGLDDHNGRQSNIFPHAKIAMESIASMPDEATKFNYTTGTMTQRNYIQKRAGIRAEEHHGYGATLVGMSDSGSWFVRQLMVDDDNAIYDIGPEGCVGGLKFSKGEVWCASEGESFVEALQPGDVHAAELQLWVREVLWGDGGLKDSLRPRYEFMHDLLSMRSRSHHEMKDFFRNFAKHVDDEETVEEEIRLTADVLSESYRDFCETIIVPSNHHDHLTRWLNEADFRLDPVNARFFCWLTHAYLCAMEEGDHDFTPMEHALRAVGIPSDVRFLSQDESFVTCKDTFVGGIENALHGHQGPNGSRGSTRNLTKLSRAVNKGHDHNAALRNKVASAGACSLDFPFMSGPTSHSISLIVTFENGARQIITMYDGKYRV